MTDEAVYRTAPATPGLLNILLLKSIDMDNYTAVTVCLAKETGGAPIALALLGKEPSPHQLGLDVGVIRKRLSTAAVRANSTLHLHSVGQIWKDCRHVTKRGHGRDGRNTECWWSWRRSHYCKVPCSSASHYRSHYTLHFIILNNGILFNISSERGVYYTFYFK